jgi:hypothetical protein
MTTGRRTSAFLLERMRDPLAVQPIGRLEEALDLLPREGEPWGFWTTAAEAHLGRLPAGEWRSILSGPRIAEARVFDGETDLHWRGDRGLRLSTRLPAATGAGPVNGNGWLQRERRSRLWGEWLAEAGGWYEERIPKPHRYQGLPEGPEACRAFLVYREYVRGGVVEYVRYLRVEGERR